MTQFGEWHEGYEGGYDVRVEHSPYDSYPNNFIALVQVRDKATGEVYTRVGHGKFIGNFSPIWISWKGERTQITEILRIVDRGRVKPRKGIATI